MQVSQRCSRQFELSTRQMVRRELDQTVVLAAESGKKEPLKPQEIEILKRWIAEGGEFAEHWAFIPPQRPALPIVSDEKWPRNDIDRFILSRLDEEGLRPAPEADKTTLIRRSALALTGLPPTIAEVDAFVADGSADAYEIVVDRLLRWVPHLHCF